LLSGVSGVVLSAVEVVRMGGPPSAQRQVWRELTTSPDFRALRAARLYENRPVDAR
jgi:hypothetical protein